MIVADLFDQINGAYRGTDDDAPSFGTTDYTLWLATANRKVSEWAHDSKNVWRSNFHTTAPNEQGTVATIGTTDLVGTSTYFLDYRVGDQITVSGETVRTIATITDNTHLTVTVAFANTVASTTFTHTTIVAVGVQSYNLHRNFLVPSDRIKVTNATQSLYYVVGEPQERDRFDNEVYITGSNPQVITFSDDIITGSQLIGATLSVPGYYVPNDLIDEDSVVEVDDPYWLVYSVAAENAFNDLTYESKTIDLNTKANNLYNQMATANRRGTSNYPRTARTNVNRIRDTSGWGVGSFD